MYRIGPNIPFINFANITRISVYIEFFLYEQQIDEFFSIYTQDEKPIHDCLGTLVAIENNISLSPIETLLEQILNLDNVSNSMKSHYCNKFKEVLDNYNYIQLKHHDRLIEISPTEGYPFVETSSNGEYLLQLPSEKDISLFQV